MRVEAGGVSRGWASGVGVHKCNSRAWLLLVARLLLVVPGHKQPFVMCSIQHIPCSTSSHQHCPYKRLRLHPPAGGQQGYLYLIETTNWTHTAWQLPAAAHLLSAAWAPNSRVVLLALSGSASHLVALHLVAPPPSLTAQMLPVTLPELCLQQQTPGTTNSSSSGEAVGIASMAWDPSGQRLAVALTAGCEVTAGCRVALYSTSYDPVVHCSFIGFLRPFAAAAGAAKSGTSAAAGSSSRRDAVQQADQQGGAGAANTGSGTALLLLFACTPPGKASAVLSVQQGLRVRSIPLYV